MITSVIGVLIMPWKLIESSNGYIFTWLIGYSALLGAIGGILICDYWVIRQRRLDLAALYDPAGRYAYNGGTNLCAVIAFLLAVFPSFGMAVVGAALLGAGYGAYMSVDQASGGKIMFLPKFHVLYPYAWFVTFGLALALYFALMKASRRP